MAENVCPITDFDTLLVSTDGSDRNEGAIREAINLAKGCGSKLYAITVVEANEEFVALAPERVEKLEKEARGVLDRIKEQGAKAGVDVEAIVHEGEHPYKFILDEAVSKKASMIIMGRRGRTGLKKLIMGSVTARVIGHSPCKVLVVPKDAHFECRNILVATDGSEDSEAAAIEAINLTKRCEGTFTVMSVYSSESGKGVAEENVQKVVELAASQDVTAETLILEGSPATSITDTARQLNADLIVVGSHGRTGLERLLMGSVTEDVIGRTECSVLVARRGV